MRWLLRAGLLIFVVAIMPVDNGFSETASDRACAEIARAAKLGDTQAVVRASRDVDNLWPDSPEGYFQVVGKVQQALAGLGESPAAKQCLSNLFVSVSEKTKPGHNKKQNTMYFDQKARTYLSFLNLDEIRKDKSRQVAIAMFIGEMRTNMIPDYANMGTSRPGLEILEQAGVNDAGALTEPVQIEAYAKAVKANEEDLLMNELQSTLRRNDRIMTFHLLDGCTRIDGADSDSKKFINSVIQNARLSEKEAKKLRREDR